MTFGTEHMSPHKRLEEQHVEEKKQCWVPEGGHAF